jgi:hypothetical protein
LFNGGEGGIRTLEQFDPLHTFQACSFSHSDTSPNLLSSPVARWELPHPASAAHSFLQPLTRSCRSSGLRPVVAKRQRPNPLRVFVGHLTKLVVIASGALGVTPPCERCALVPSAIDSLLSELGAAPRCREAPTSKLAVQVCRTPHQTHCRRQWRVGSYPTCERCALVPSAIDSLLSELGAAPRCREAPTSKLAVQVCRNLTKTCILSFAKMLVLLQQQVLCT